MCMCENACARVIFVYVYAHRYQKKGVLYPEMLLDMGAGLTLVLTTQLSHQPPENFYACKNTVLH